MTKENEYTERLDYAGKLVSENNYLEAIRILEELKTNECSDPLRIKQYIKDVIILYISFLEEKGFKFIEKKQYSDGVELFNKLIEFITNNTNKLGIDKRVLTQFVVENMNDVERSGVKFIALGSETFKDLRKKVHDRAMQMFSEKTKVLVLETLADCFIFAEVFKDKHNEGAR